MATTDEIKSRLDIVDFVGRHVPLQKSGRSFKAVCPFHSEKTPSFFVFPERQTWRCFGACAEGGDIFSFLMRLENLTFTEALNRLSEEAGVPMPARRQRADEEPIYQINEAAREYFSQLLESESGAGARKYLEGRGLTSGSISAFELGLSPPDGRRLREHLATRGHSTEQMARAGLVTQSQGGRYRDLFRNRLIFPIRDAQGHLLGFGGRALDDSTPKYLNTPQSSVFNKGRILYGLDRAREAIRKEKQAVVVEGYMDVIGPHQQGFRNVIAQMGTALTESQVSLLRRQAPSVVLALDPDEAGQEATLRSLSSSWRTLQQQEAARVRNRERGTDTILYHRPDIPDLKVARLPEGQDPDEIVIKDPTTWRRLIETAVPFMDFMFTALSSRFDLNSPEGKRDYAELLFPMVTAHANPFEQDQYVQRLAHMLGVSEQILVARMGRSRPARSRAAARRRRPEPVVTSFERMEHDPLEEFCLSILLKHPEIVSRSSGLGLEHFKRIENRELFTLWQKNVNINTMGESLDHELREHVEHLLSKELPPETLAEREAALEDCLHRLEERRLRELKVEEEMRLAAIPHEDFLEEASHVLELNERLKRLYHMNPDPDME